MTILAVDDEYHAMRVLEKAIRQAAPDCELKVFDNPRGALACASETKVDVAFLDLEMRGMHGLILAQKIKERNGSTNIVFVTGHQEYARDAFSLHVSGYLVKPVSADDIKKELEDLRHPVLANHAGVFIRTFGNFEVLVGGEPVMFRRSKSKEVLAYLVDRSGAGVTRREIAGMLWEEGDYSRGRQHQVQTFIRAMMADLKTVGADHIVIRKRNYLAMDVGAVSCDLYHYQQGNIEAVNTYVGQYMAQYSWGEFTTALLDHLQPNRLE